MPRSPCDSAPWCGLGIAFDASGNLWEQEMGPRGGDEVNLILPGRNYGYPIVSDGDHYDGRAIPDHATRPEFEKPRVSLTPVISPGGLIVYSGKLWPEWTGDLFIGGLSSQALIRVDVDGTNARKGDQWPMGERIREPEEGPDGAIWLLEDGRQGGKGPALEADAPGLRFVDEARVHAESVARNVAVRITPSGRVLGARGVGTENTAWRCALNVSSWHQLDGWLRQVDALRRAA